MPLLEYCLLKANGPENIKLTKLMSLGDVRRQFLEIYLNELSGMADLKYAEPCFNNLYERLWSKFYGLFILNLLIELYGPDQTVLKLDRDPSDEFRFDLSPLHAIALDLPPYVRMVLDLGGLSGTVLAWKTKPQHAGSASPEAAAETAPRYVTVTASTDSATVPFGNTSLGGIEKFGLVPLLETVTAGSQEVTIGLGDSANQALPMDRQYLHDSPHFFSKEHYDIFQQRLLAALSSFSAMVCCHWRYDPDYPAKHNADNEYEAYRRDETSRKYKAYKRCLTQYAVRQGVLTVSQQVEAFSLEKFLEFAEHKIAELTNVITVFSGRYTTPPECPKALPLTPFPPVKILPVPKPFARTPEMMNTHNVAANALNPLQSNPSIIFFMKVVAANYFVSFITELLNPSPENRQEKRVARRDAWTARLENGQYVPVPTKLGRSWMPHLSRTPKIPPEKKYLFTPHQSVTAGRFYDNGKNAAFPGFYRELSLQAGESCVGVFFKAPLVAGAAEVNLVSIYEGGTHFRIHKDYASSDTVNRTIRKKLASSIWFNRPEDLLDCRPREMNEVLAYLSVATDDALNSMSIFIFNNNVASQLTAIIRAAFVTRSLSELKRTTARKTPIRFYDRSNVRATDFPVFTEDAQQLLLSDPKYGAWQALHTFFLTDNLDVSRFNEAQVDEIRKLIIVEGLGKKWLQHVENRLQSKRDMINRVILVSNEAAALVTSEPGHQPAQQNAFEPEVFISSLYRKAMRGAWTDCLKYIEEMRPIQLTLFPHELGILNAAMLEAIKKRRLDVLTQFLAGMLSNQMRKVDYHVLLDAILALEVGQNEAQRERLTQQLTDRLIASKPMVNPTGTLAAAASNSTAGLACAAITAYVFFPAQAKETPLSTQLVEWAKLLRPTELIPFKSPPSTPIELSDAQSRSIIEALTQKSKDQNHLFVKHYINYYGHHLPLTILYKVSSCTDVHEKNRALACTCIDRRSSLGISRN